jgi:hypothetical protein
MQQLLPESRKYENVWKQGIPTNISVALIFGFAKDSRPATLARFSPNSSKTVASSCHKSCWNSEHVRTLHSTRNKQIQARVWLQVYGLLSKAGHSSCTTDTDSHKSSTQCHTIAFRCLYMYLSLQCLHISLLFHVALCSNLYDRTGKVWFPPQHPNEYRHWEHLWENSEANASGHQLHLNLSEMDWSNMKQLLFKLQNCSGEKLRGCCSKPQIFRAGKYMYIQKLLMSSKCKCRSKAWRTHIPNSKLVKPTS